MFNPDYLASKVAILKGLEGFTRLLSRLFDAGLKNIDKGFIRTNYPNYCLVGSSKESLVAALDAELENPEVDQELRNQLLKQKEELMAIYDEICLETVTEQFKYHIALREEDKRHNLLGFVKIMHTAFPRHQALVTWNDNRDPILFLIEFDNDGNRFFHCNYGKQGYALLQEDKENYYWTQSSKSEYTQIMAEISNGELGTVMMNKASKEFELCDGNLNATKALTNASKIGQNGKPLIENNFDLIKLYEKDLQGNV